MASLLVSRSRLRFFAEATGQTDPIYVDLDAARRAGHRDLPVPPTFFFGVDLEEPDPFGYLAGLGVDLRSVLHGEQEFVYSELAYAGDELTTTPAIVDDYEKKGGALRFLVRETPVTNQHGRTVATMRCTLVVRT
ncbi:MaoC family dehydratase N-terminal domain-containing protein [Cryptosporangium sp. NPDC051539]|uniref:MaoC family dehydratase N-terminal domain-containing protein n=1 Tax=Cryptosporangium sp. NPDC051539 TaxID=3363962 RepID=UPI0037A8A338